MNMHPKVMKELQRRGIDTSKEIPTEAYDKARLAIRTAPEIIKAGAKRTKARLSNRTGIGTVSEDRALIVLTICRSNQCGSYDKLKGGEEVCHRCNCHGKDLHNKASQKKEFCPHEPALWDNRKRK